MSETSVGLLCPGDTVLLKVKGELGEYVVVRQARQALKVVEVPSKSNLSFWVEKNFVEVLEVLDNYKEEEDEDDFGEAWPVNAS